MSVGAVGFDLLIFGCYRLKRRLDIKSEVIRIPGKFFQYFFNLLYEGVGVFICNACL